MWGPRGGRRAPGLGEAQRSTAAACEPPFVGVLCIVQIDKDENRILVRSETINCLIRHPDKTYYVSFAGNKDQQIKELNVFKSLEDAYVWMTML